MQMPSSVADTGIARYDAMVQAIAECHRVDEVKELRNKARALEVYAQQAMNLEAERQAAGVRIRAERRAGELLKEMKQNGQRQKQAQPSKLTSSGTRLTAAPVKLAALGITYDQSSKWQQLADVPQEDFEFAVTSPGPAPTTEGIINAHVLKKHPMPRMDPNALWVWGRLRDLEEREIFQTNPSDLLPLMTDPMRDDCARIVPALIHWLKTF